MPRRSTNAKKTSSPRRPRCTCFTHDFVYSGRTPCTGPKRCLRCGAMEGTVGARCSRSMCIFKTCQCRSGNPASIGALFTSAVVAGAASGAAATAVNRALGKNPLLRVSGGEVNPKNPSGHVVTAPGSLKVTAAYYGHPVQTFQRASGIRDGDVWFSLSSRRYKKGDTYQPSLLERGGPVVSYRKGQAYQGNGPRSNAKKFAAFRKAWSQATCQVCGARSQVVVGKDDFVRCADRKACEASKRALRAYQKVRECAHGSPRHGPPCSRQSLTPRASNPGKSRKARTITLAQAQRLNPAGFRENLAAFRRFHGCDPKKVTIFEVPDGKKTVSRKAGFVVGKAPEIAYEDVPAGSNKTGKTWIHEFGEKGGSRPTLVHDAVAGVTSAVGGSYSVSDWYRR